MAQTHGSATPNSRHGVRLRILRAARNAVSNGFQPWGFSLRLSTANPQYSAQILILYRRSFPFSFPCCGFSRRPLLWKFSFGNSPFAKYLNYTPLYTIQLLLPYFDRAAYRLKLEGIKVGNSLLPIPKSVFLPDHTGAGQTMIDSGTQFTFLVAEAYALLKLEFVRQNHGLLLNPLGGNFVFQGALDLCYQQPVSSQFPQMLTPVTLLFDSAEMTIDGHQLLYQIPQSSAGSNAAKGMVIYCFTFGNSDLVAIEANIIGNHHQQNMWIEYDLQNSRIGFARASCNIN